MADVKFSELTSLAASDVAAADIFAVVDTSASTSKKLTVDNLFGAIPVNIAVTDTTDSSSNTTGSITTTGGVGISKNLYVGEDVFIFGNTTIGGASSDTVAITADVASDIIPDGDGTRDLGDGSNQFSNLFVNNITTTAFTANSTSILIAGTDKLFFQDTGTNIQSPTDGTLDIAADTILEVTAPTTNVIASTALTIHTPAISANGTLTIGADDTAFDINFHTATANKRWFLDESEDTIFQELQTIRMKLQADLEHELMHFMQHVSIGTIDAPRDLIAARNIYKLNSKTGKPMKEPKHLVHKKGTMIYGKGDPVATGQEKSLKGYHRHGKNYYLSPNEFDPTIRSEVGDFMAGYSAVRGDFKKQILQHFRASEFFRTLKKYDRPDFNSLDDLTFRVEHERTATVIEGTTAVFLIHVDIYPLKDVLKTDFGLIKGAIDSMSESVLEYKNLVKVKELMNEHILST